MGGALSGDERQAAAARVVLARLHGQCDGTIGRSAVSLPRAASGLTFRRWWLLDAHGRFPEPETAQSAGEGRSVQQWRTRLHRARAKVSRFSCDRYGTTKSELCRHG